MYFKRNKAQNNLIIMSKIRYVPILFNQVLIKIVLLQYCTVLTLQLFSSYLLWTEGRDDLFLLQRFMKL